MLRNAGCFAPAGPWVLKAQRPHLPDVFDEEFQSHGDVPPVRIIDVVARPHRQPILQHDPERARCDEMGHGWLRGVDQAASKGDQRQREMGLVDRERTRDRHGQCLAIPLEIPTVEMARSKPDAQAAMMLKILRMLGGPEAIEISGGAPYAPANIGRERVGYHVFWHRSTEADAGIKAALDHVDQAIADRDFEFDVRVAFDEARQDWREKIGRGILRHVQPDAPRWPFAEAVQVVDRLPDCCHWLCKRAVELLARGRQRYAARCSVDKANPEPSFETLQCVA